MSMKNWMPVDDLPTEKNTIFLSGQNGDVLCQLDDETIIMGNYSGNVWRLYWKDGLSTLAGSLRTVKYWMPLPGPKI